jgi:uncharacterized protein YutE (UPF0331/DUF86 family)
MSGSAVRQRRARRVRDLARAYRSAGYQVTVNPPESELPTFLHDFQPDLVAISDEESVVVEVKSQADLVAAEDIPQLASLVNAQPKWRFELVVTSTDNPNQVVEADVVWERLSATHRLTGQHQFEAAFLLLWSATEAVLRIIAARERVNVERLSPAEMVKQLASLGVLGRDDQRILQRGADVRNRLVHGYTSATVDSALVEKIGDVTERLLEDGTADETTSDQD